MQFRHQVVQQTPTMLMPMRLTIFFCFYDTNVASNSVSAELDMYINDTSHDIDSLLTASHLSRKCLLLRTLLCPQVLLWNAYLALEGRS